MVFSPRNQGAQVGYCVFDSFSTPKSLLSMPTPVLLNIPFSHSTVHTTNSKVQTLQHKASEWSGVQTSDAFAIDDTNLFQKLGLQSFLNLSTEFYNRLSDDEEEWFRSIFANSKKEDAIQNQYEFFVRRRRGPPLYSRKRGHPALIARHRPFPVMHQAAERWLHHTQHALDSTSDIDDDSKIKMINFFRHNCIFSGGRR